MRTDLREAQNFRQRSAYGIQSEHAFFWRIRTNWSVVEGRGMNGVPENLHQQFRGKFANGYYHQPQIGKDNMFLVAHGGEFSYLGVQTLDIGFGGLDEAFDLISHIGEPEGPRQER